MKLINQVKKHGKAVTFHLKRHHKKYIFGILSVSLFVKGLSLLVAHTLVHNLSFANTDTGDNNDSIITTELDNNELSGNLDEGTDGLDDTNNTGSSENPEEPEDSAEPEEPAKVEEPIVPEEPAEPEEPAKVEELTVPEEPAEPEEPAKVEELTVPEEPAEPEEPAKVEEPIVPEEPAEPEEPAKVEEPIVPEEPAEPEEPAKVENPEEPENSTNPEEPENTEDPKEPENLIDPEEPVITENSEEATEDENSDNFVATRGLGDSEDMTEELEQGDYYFEDDFLDDEEYPEYFEDELDEDYDEPMPQEIYDNTKGDTYNLDTFEKAVKEVAYAYYMRGPRIQYNSLKANASGSWLSPEEATTQDSNYLVCSAFTRNVYYDLLKIKIPTFTDDLINYTTGHIGSPEVVGYGVKSGGNFIMKIYDHGVEYMVYENPNLSDIIPYLRIGDVLTYNGHTLMVYDLVYKSGSIDDVILMQSAHGEGKGYVKTKIGVFKEGSQIGRVNAFLYHNSKTGVDGLLEGSLNLKSIKNESYWSKIGTSSGKTNYSILRFVQENESGNAVLTYGGYSGFSLPDKTKSRLKFSKLFIEKTVSEHDDDMVELGSTMTYTIAVKNNSNEDYTDDLFIIENLSQFVTYVGYTSTKEGIDFNQNSSILTWNIGKLRAGEEVIIEYSVNVNGNIGDTIVSTGKVGEIPSATIKNKIGKALNEEQGNNIKNAFENLKSDYNGKNLINKIYEESFGADLNFEEFDITNLINNSKLYSTSYATISGNQENSFYKMILNKYWSTLKLSKYNYENTPTIYAYLGKYWRPLSYSTRRADTIYSENFRTGDILIYTNTNDNKYKYSQTDGLTVTPITYEDGEYAYIYIDGKFVGVNLGNDGVKDQGTRGDDRNEFTRQYYIDNGLSWYSHTGVLLGKTDEFKNNLQYQTLFGKDYYVILRPSLMIRNIDYELDGGTGNDENPSAFILGSNIELKEPTKSGFAFKGWYTDSEYTTQVTNTNELTDDVVLYAKWENNTHELTTFEKAFQEVAYAYYMRGPYIHYNSAKGRGHDFSPEEATSQDYNYLACGLYVLNVYRELLGNFITFPYHGGQNAYAKQYVGKRPEVIGYGEKTGGDLYWWDETTQYLPQAPKVINPTKNDIINQLQIGDIFGYDGHVTMVYDYKYNENGDKEDVYLIHATDSPQYRVYSKMNLGATVYDNSGNSYDLSIGHNKWSAIRYNIFDRTAQSEHHPDARVEGTVQLNIMSNMSSVLKFNTGNYSSHYYILRFVTDDGSGNSILSINGTGLAGYRECSTCSYTNYSGQINYSDSVQSRLKYNKLYIEKTVNRWDDSVVGADDELTYTIKIQNNSDKIYDENLIVKEIIDTNLVENLGLYSYKKNGIQTQEIQLSNNEDELQWNIGKLNRGDEVIIEYTVKVRPGNIGETIESTGMVGDIPSGIITNTIGRNTDKGANLKAAYNNLNNNFTGKFLINEIYKEVYGIDLGLDKIVEINTGNELDTGALIYYNNKWGSRNNNWDSVEMQINRKNPYSGMILNGYFNVLYKNINDAHAVNKSGDEITITRYGFPAIAVKTNDVDKRADTIFPGNFQTGDILIYKNSNDLYYSWKTSSGYSYSGYAVSHTNTYENGEYAYIYMDGKFVGMNLGNDLTGIKDNRNEFTTNYYSNVGINSRYYTDSGVGIPQNIPGGFNNWLHYQSLFGKEAYVILRPSLMIRNITYELSGGTNNAENPSAFILGRDVELEEPTKSGFTFEGWYTDSEYTTQVTNTNELTDDVVLYAKWENSIHELTTFEKAFQEVAYAYYMRGPYIHYNVAKGKSDVLPSPEESTCQDYNYMACALYAMNVFKELLGIDLSYSDTPYTIYGREIGNRKEVIGRGELQTSGADSGSLYWYDGSKNESGELNVIKDPAQSYVISQLRIGDILHYAGHVMLVYDLIYDNSGNVVDAYLLHAMPKGYYYTKGKGYNPKSFIYDISGNKVSLNIGHGPWSNLYYNINDRRGVYEESKIEGTLALELFTERADIGKILLFDKSNSDNKYVNNYEIIRFVTTEGGKDVLNFYGDVIYGGGNAFQGETVDDGEIEYSDSVKSRLKYSKLYIEKTVDKRDNNIVQPNDELTYKVIIKNESKEDYENYLVVKENINTNLVQNLSRYVYTKNGVLTNDVLLQLEDDDQLQWNIGKLNSGDEVIIEYTVKVKTGHIGETIESTGLVDNIPSGKVKNKIGKNTNKGEELKQSYNNLRGSYTGKNLINQIYEEAYGINLGLDNLNILTNTLGDTNGLVYFNNKWGSTSSWIDSTYMSISTGNIFSGMVLNSYFNALYKALSIKSLNSTGIEITVQRYALPAIGLRKNDPDERASTIYPTDFQTGDILIYINENDIKYSLLDNGKTARTYLTFEDGEYAYIYIDGKFVGVNLGNDGVKDQGTGGDDRNEFTIQYYKDNNRSRYGEKGIGEEVTDELEDWLQYQTLFGKDAYVILRPSLMIRSIDYELDGGINDDQNPRAFILRRDVELKEPTRTGYVFSGWYTDPEYTTKVNNTNELADDVVLYAKWELTTFEKAFQEVAYAYYMRGPYMHYNAAKSMSDILSPEESTSQDYHYMTCTPYVMNVYKELLGIVLTSADEQYGTYARDYVGIRPEVIGYGEKSGANLYWWDGTTQYSESPQRVNPDQSYIISQLKIGDILYYAGHTMLVYDYVYSGNDIVDVYLLHSWQANYVTRTKADHSNKEKYYNENGQEVGLKLGNSQRSRLGYNYRDRIGIYPGLSRVEGTVILERLREHKYLTFTQPYESKYSILRLVTTNSSGEDLLNFNGQWTGGDQYNTKKFLYYGFLALGTGPDTLYESDNSLKTFNNQIINNYSDSVQSRLKYSKLYIEKTVDKKDNNIVEPDDELTYKIMIKNESRKNYEDNLVVRENIDTNLVEYLSRTSTSDIQLIPNNENQLQRNIGKLDSGNEVKIEYTVKVKTGHIGETIESTGLVDNIPSGIVKNKIGKNTDKGEELKESFNNLSDNYTGKILINKIYGEVYGVDLGLNGLIMTGYINRNGTIIEGQSGLIFYTKTGNAGWNPKIHNYMYINPEHPFSGMVLNNYFNTLRRERYSAIGDTKITLYEVPTLLPYKNPDNRANTIYPTDFKTGDILIYINENDVKYTTGLNSSGDKINKEIPITYEDGEYAYIYIDGKFMGVNLGNDGVKDQKTGGDDRNEFGTVEYHVVNKVDSYKRELPLSGEYRETENSGCRKEIHESYCIKIPNDELKEFLRYQTLFGKDAYVVLRPSLMIRNITYDLSGGTNNDENPNVFILGRDVELKEPTKTGYVFSGWYTDSEYTNQVYNTNELTDDIVLYAKWENNIHELTTFEKAFQEVAYSYYMRGPSIQYNLAKGIGSIVSPEQSTNQDYHHMACTTYVMNVYNELLGINLSANGAHYSRYAKKYVGVRPEVIGYGLLQTGGDDKGSLYWYDGTTQYSSTGYNRKDPTQSYIISQLRIGDIIQYGGHSMLVYDYKYDSSGKIEDVYLLNSLQTNYYMSKMKAGHLEGSYYYKSGVAKSLEIFPAPWSNLYFTYRDRSGWYEGMGRIEGTIRLEKFTGRAGFSFPGFATGDYREYYAILRFVTTDSSGNSVLNFSGGYTYFKSATQTGVANNQIIEYSDSVKSRLKYSKLYIEKTVDKKDNNVVEPGDELTYTIRIQNNSDQAYDDDLIIKENINTDLVENLSLYSYEKNGTQIQEIQLLNDGNQLQWNIGKLNSGDEVIIEYTVKVKTGYIGETIESTGLVNHIPSGTIKNKIGRKLNEHNSSGIVSEYDILKAQYTGKILINEIYKKVYGVDLGLDDFIITGNTNGESSGLILYNQKSGTWYYGGTTHAKMYINPVNLFSGMVLNNYFNTLYVSTGRISDNNVNITLYAIPAIWKEENNPDNKANIIYPTDFKTGDVLIYTNTNDVKYSVSGHDTVKNYMTYEDGEYAYIYMDGKFVGVNLGNDLEYTGDDRNEFTRQYYDDNNLSWYSKSSTPLEDTEELKEFLQYQTLFGKDAYVILRPSLVIRNITYELSGGTNNDENPNVFILGRDVELKEPIRTGYVFSGWYTDSEYTTQVTNTNELTDDVVLYAKWENIYTVTWKNRDGTVLEIDENVEYGSSPEYNGSIPTRTGDVQYSYTFAGWSPATGVVQGDQTYTAQYTTSINEYLITFKNYDGSILETSMIPYGDTPYYQGETPKKEPDQQYYYVFSEWTPEIVPVIGTATYTAQFNTVGTNEYTITLIVSPTGYGAFSQYSVTAIYGSNIIFDGNTLIVSGTTVTATPRSNPKYTYNFSGRINSCGDTLTHNCTITGEFTRSTNTYTVTWKNRDGTVLETDEDVEYGSSPEYNGSIPTRTGDAQYSYTFYGWGPTTGVVQGDQTYTAQYTTSINEYLITFKNYDGSILETGIVVYGETPTYNGNTPSKEGGYEFSGWNPTIHPVNGIQVYTAMFRDIQGPTGEIIVSYLSGYLTNGCTSGNITLTLTGSDINGLATEPYKRDDGSWTANDEKTFTNNAHGTGYIKDTVGNVTPIPYNITGISKTGLVISLDSPEDGSILTGFVKLEWAASIINPTCQALSGGYNIIVYSGTEEVYTGNTVSTSIDSTFQDGTYTWKVYANDILGHTSTSETWTFIIDKQAPTCDIDYTPAESLGWTSGDVQSILTGCSQGTTGFNVTGHLFTGNGTYEFTFRNELGITGNKIAHVRRIDKIPPYLQEVTPIGTTTDTTPNYTFSSTESGNIAYSGACRSTTTQAISGNNTITLNALAVGTYSGCTITVRDRAGNTSNVLNISEFTIRSSGGGGLTLKRDKCPGGDFSDSYYDGICENNRKNTHNAPNTDIGSSYQRGDEFIYDKQIFDSKYSDEMNQAYQFAYYYGITTKNSISAADVNGGLTRIAMAKMLSQYAINVLGKEPDSTRQNTFVDVSSKLDSDYSSGVTLAYQLGIMGINMKDNKFRPYDTVSRAEFVTALSRLLYGIEDGKDKYYSTHMNLLKYLGIITNTDPTMKELRGYVMLMIMRSEKIKNN